MSAIASGFNEKFLICHKLDEHAEFGSWSIDYVGEDGPITPLDIAAILTTIVDFAVGKVPESEQNQVEAQILQLFQDLVGNRHEFMEIKSPE